MMGSISGLRTGVDSIHFWNTSATATGISSSGGGYCALALKSAQPPQIVVTSNSPVLAPPFPSAFSRMFLIVASDPHPA